MLTTQTNIALQLVATLSAEEMQAFANEFSKLYKPVVKQKPKKDKKPLLPDTQVLAMQILERHRAKNNIPTQKR